MDTSGLAELLDVLRDRGVTAAEVEFSPMGICGIKVTLGPAPTAALVDDDTDKPEPEEPLPPGAFDPIARRKQAASG
jgi:hypothetical protein